MRAYSIFKKKEDAIKYSINRFDDDTIAAFLDLYTKVDSGVDMELENEHPDYDPEERANEEYNDKL